MRMKMNRCNHLPLCLSVSTEYSITGVTAFRLTFNRDAGINSCHTNGNGSCRPRNRDDISLNCAVCVSLCAVFVHSDI